MSDVYKPMTAPVADELERLAEASSVARARSATMHYRHQDYATPAEWQAAYDEARIKWETAESAFRTALTAALAAPYSAKDGWRTMDSAPRDGGYFLVAYKTGEWHYRTSIARHDPFYKVSQWNVFGAGYVPNGSPDLVGWQPLPEWLPAAPNGDKR